MARLIIVFFAVLTGLAIATVTWLSDAALSHFRNVANMAWWAPLVWTPIVTCLVVYATRTWFEGASGSGIPQVIASLSSKADHSDGTFNRSLYVSLKLSVAKAFLTTGGLLAGLSTGREGPSVQIAAGIMHHARRWLPNGSGISARALIAAGGAAGVAAAFNTPLGGVMFAIEQLSSQPERKSSGLLIVAIVLSGLVAMSIHGDQSYFGQIQSSPPHLGNTLASYYHRFECWRVGRRIGDGTDAHTEWPLGSLAALATSTTTVLGGTLRFGSGHHWRAHRWSQFR